MNCGYIILLIAACGLMPLGCAQLPQLALRTRCLTVLEDALDDPSAVVVTHAAEALIAAGQPDGLQVQFEGLLRRVQPDRDQQELQTILAARVLYQLGDHQVIDQVLSILNDPDSSHRPTAAETLGKLRYLPALDQIRTVVAGERKPACSALWAYGVGALAKCEDRAAQQALLAEGFSSPCSNVRRITANDLSAIRLPEALPRIQAMAAAETDTLTRVNAAGALLQYGDYSGLTILRDATQDGNPTVRKHAVRACGAATDDSLLGMLEPRLQDSDTDVRVMAADAILRVIAHAQDAPAGNESSCPR